MVSVTHVSLILPLLTVSYLGLGLTYGDVFGFMLQGVRWGLKGSNRALQAWRNHLLSEKEATRWWLKVNCRMWRRKRTSSGSPVMTEQLEASWPIPLASKHLQIQEAGIASRFSLRPGGSCGGDAYSEPPSPRVWVESAFNPGGNRKVSMVGNPPGRKMCPVVRCVDAGPHKLFCFYGFSFSLFFWISRARNGKRLRPV